MHGKQGGRAGAYAAIFAVSLAIIAPAFFMPTLIHVDHVFALSWSEQFTAEMARGDPWPRWLPDALGGLGAPTFYFTPPLPYWVAGLFGLLGLSSAHAVLVTYGIAAFASGVGTYEWLRDKGRFAVLAALFFVAAPYHLLDFWWRGAFSETVGIVCLPFLAWGLERVVNYGRWRLAALAYGLLILCHIPLALLTSIFFIAPYALLHRQRLTQFALAVLVGIALAAPFLVPAIGLDDARETAMLHDPDGFTPALWTIPQIEMWRPFAQETLLTYAALGVAGLALWMTTRSRWALAALGLLGLISLVPPLWHLPLLERVQFPMRALPIVELLLAAAIARMSRLTPMAMLALIVPLLWSLSNIRPDIIRSWNSVEPPIEGSNHLPVGVYEGKAQFVTGEEIRDLVLPPPDHRGMVVEERFWFPIWSCGTKEPETGLILRPPDCQPMRRMTPFEMIGFALFALAMALLLWRRRRTAT